MNGINAWLDRTPRATIWASGREVPAFRAIGVVGAHMMIVVTMTIALVLDLSLLTAIGMIAVTITSFFSWALLRKWITGREDLVLLEHTWLAIAAVAAYATWLDEPVWPWLDVAAAGICVFLAFGRVGCFVAGCCYGAPSEVGVVYAAQSHPRAGIRLFPVQLVEAAALSALAIASFVIASATSAGTAIVTTAAAYAVIRFGTEGLRADHRPTTARAMALMQLIAACIANELRVPGLTDLMHVIVPALSLIAVTLVAALWRRPAPLSPEIVGDVRAFVDQATASGREPVVHQIHRAGHDVTVAMSENDGSRHISISVPARMAGVAARVSSLALGRSPDVISRNGVAHTVIDLRKEPGELKEPDGQAPLSQRRRYFGASTSG